MIVDVKMSPAIRCLSRCRSGDARVLVATYLAVRNKVRRRLREIYRLHEDQFAPGYDIVVVARVRAVHSSYAVLERDFLRLAKKLQLLPSQEGKKP